MFLGLLDLAPDPGSGIICTDPDPDPYSIIEKQKSKKNLDFYYCLTSFLTFYL
jgi:hypothetical protein